MSGRTIGFILYMIGAALLQVGTALIWLSPNEVP